VWQAPVGAKWKDESNAMKSEAKTRAQSKRTVQTLNVPSMNASSAGNTPLGNRVYEFLREQLRSQALKPGSEIQTGELAKALGVSKTPLRDALIQLKSEGFLQILPQRGVVINSLGAGELKELVQVLGGLESQALKLAFPHLNEPQVAQMTEINARLIALLPQRSAVYREYNRLNIEFHDVYLDACGNTLLIDQIQLLKDRMYHFPDKDYGDRWRRVNTEEHQVIIQAIVDRDEQFAASYMRDVHWSFDQNKPKIEFTRKSLNST
jgi:DNA-binding GntR family transcriptional regulator